MGVAGGVLLLGNGRCRPDTLAIELFHVRSKATTPMANHVDVQLTAVQSKQQRHFVVVPSTSSVINPTNRVFKFTSWRSTRWVPFGKMACQDRSMSIRRSSPCLNELAHEYTYMVEDTFCRC
jgi:hypothetical protein